MLILLTIQIILDQKVKNLKNLSIIKINKEKYLNLIKVIKRIIHVPTMKNIKSCHKKLCKELQNNSDVDTS